MENQNKILISQKEFYFKICYALYNTEVYLYMCSL